MTQVTFPAAPDSVDNRAFAPEFYMRRVAGTDEIDIGFLKRNGEDYIWCLISKADFINAVRLLLPEELKDA